MERVFRILLFLLSFRLGFAQSVPQYSVNAGGSDLSTLGWTSSDSTDGLTVLTPTGKVYKYEYTNDVAVTPEGQKYVQQLYQTMLWTPDDHIKFVFEVADKTPYQVKLHFADFSKTKKDQREFDIVIEEQVVEENFDIYEAVMSAGKPLVKSYPVVSSGTKLSIQLNRKAGNPIIGAIEIIPKSRLEIPEADADIPAPASNKLVLKPNMIDFGEVGIGAKMNKTVQLTSAVPQMVTAIQFVDKELIQGFEFQYQIAGQDVRTGGLDLIFPIAVRISSTPTPLTIWFSPRSPVLYDITIVLYGGKLRLGQLQITGSGDDNNVQSGHTLHPVISPMDPVYIDWDGDGEETLEFVSQPSHTHGPGRSLVRESFLWFDENDKQVQKGPILKTSQVVGSHTVVLLIYDDQGEGAAEYTNYSVADPTSVPGAWKAYYPGADSLSGLGSAKPSFAQTGDKVTASKAGVNAGLEVPYVVEVTAIKTFKEATTLAPKNIKTGMEHELLVDGKAYSGGALTGQKTITFRVVVTSESELESEPGVQMTVGTKTKTLDWVTHDQSSVVPVITEMTPNLSSAEGGQIITLRGLGFDTKTAVITVDGAEVETQEASFDILGGFMKFVSPPGKSGAQDVQISAGTRTSNTLSLMYEEVAKFAPVKFSNVYNPIQGAATGVAYCFGYVFVAEGSGSSKGGGFTIYQYTINDDYELTEVQELKGASSGVDLNGVIADTILGLACDPWGSDDDFSIFASISKVYTNGGEGPNAYIPNTGAIIFLKSSEDFDTAHIAIKNLPVSDHDHAVNGIVFLNSGDLLINVGGDTNAGIAHTKLGGLTDGPLSSAILAAPVKQAGFDGDIQYEFIDGESPPEIDPMDGRNRAFVQVASGDVSVYAPGLRNPFGVALCAHDLSVYATDNGPNKNFGGRMFGPPVNGQLQLAEAGDINGINDPGTLKDKLLKIEEGNYYGHCNQGRARAGAEEQWYCYTADDSAPGVTPPLQLLENSSNGIACYRAETFNGGAKGDLFVQAYTKSFQYRVITQDGEYEAEVGGAGGNSNLELTVGLAVAEGPGGTMLVGQHGGNCEGACKLIVNVPEDASTLSGTMKLYQIDPWRSPGTQLGDTTFEITGANIPLGEMCSVTIGEEVVEGTAESDKKITGILPSLPSAPAPYDVIVDCNGMAGSLMGHYYALPAFGVGSTAVL